MSGPKGFSFEDSGIATILKLYRLEVPLYQREYSWGKDEINDLFTDFQRAKSEQSDHFLGTVVTINQGTGAPLQIVDGQQRLTTTSLLIAAIRDQQAELGRREDAIGTITRDYLSKFDIHEDEDILRLTLNVDDREFFGALITGRPREPERESHFKILEAHKIARAFVKQILNPFAETDRIAALNDWLKFLDLSASVILVKTENASRAFKMFETLNDRGLKTSQADLVKSFLFGESRERIEEAQARWSSMKDNLEEIDDDDRAINFLRHAVTATMKFVRADDIFDAVQKACRGKTAALKFLNDLETLSRRYVATFQPSSSFWDGYSQTTTKALVTFNRFDLKPVRPLLLALALKFEPKRFEAAIELLVSISVRLVIASRTRTGSNEQAFAAAALQVFNGEIADNKGLIAALRNVIVTDIEFAEEFAKATVSKTEFARYYLHALEAAYAEESEPWHVTNDDPAKITLEHVLPQKLNNGWGNFDQEMHRAYMRRIGNLCLLTKTGNNIVGGKPFTEKRPTLSTAGLELTKAIGANQTWGPSEIEGRQRMLAQLAVRAWPIPASRG